MDGNDLEDCVFFLRRSKAEQQFGRLEQQAEKLVFPLECLFGQGSGFEGWLDRVIKLRPEGEAEKDDLKERLRAVKTEWLQVVDEYNFPMVTLADATSAEAVCTTFETLNRTGVKLSVFDLLAARFWSADLRLRDLWDCARETYPLLREFESDPYYILQGVAILAARGAPSCKRGDVLDMEPDRVRQGWNSVVRGMAYALEILRDDCGVVLPQWLPYYPIVIPAAAALASVESAKGTEVGKIRQRLTRWFWCSCFGQAYENAPNSQAVQDYTELRRWFADGEPPKSVREFRFDPATLRDTTVRQRAVYRGVMALILRNGARDFYANQPITAALVHSRSIDDHHVFPGGYLAEKRPDVSPTLRDCVLNRTLIDKDTNLRIGKRPPSSYLKEMVAPAAPTTADPLLRSHLMPDSEDSPLWQDDFDAFLAARQELIWQQMLQVTS